jgi:hypothetical protein
MENYRARSGPKSESTQIDRTNRVPLSDETREELAAEIFERYSKDSLNSFVRGDRFDLDNSSLEELKTYLDNIYYADGNRDDEEIAYLDVGFQFAVAEKYLQMRSVLKKAA